MDEDPDQQMSGHDFSDDESTENGFEDDHLPEYDPSMVDMEEITKGFIHMVCSVDDFPPRAMECPIFKKFIRTLNPCIQLEDFQTVKRGCLKFYEEERLKIAKILRNRDGQISLTVETFRCYESFKVYACVTAHFIDDNWNHKRWVLRFQNVDNVALVHFVQKTIKWWGIADKIFTVTFQGFHYDPDTFEEEIKSHIQCSKQLELDGLLLDVYCCAKLFRKMLKVAFGEISDIIRKLKEFISFNTIDNFWNVTNSKLKEALDFKSMGEITREIVGDDVWPSDEEWKKVEQIHELVDKLHSAAKLIFVRKYATGSTFLVGLNDLREGLKMAASSSCTFTNAIAEKMLLRLDTYWKIMFLLLALAAVMDPRCKMVYIDFISSKMEHCQQPNVLEAFCSLYDKYATTNTGTGSNTTTNTVTRSNAATNTAIVGQENSGTGTKATTNIVNVRHENSRTGSNSLYPESDDDASAEEDESDDDASAEEDGCSSPVNHLSSHLQDFLEFSHTTNRAPRSDLDWYLEEPIIPWDANFDLLAWWKAQSPKYPTLSKLARDILSIQFSVPTSYDVYCIEERSVKENLLSAGDVLMNALMCTRSWHQSKDPKK